LRGTVAMVLQEHFGSGIERRAGIARTSRKPTVQKTGVEVMSF
jgi:hypothetical protein